MKNMLFCLFIVFGLSAMDNPQATSFTAHEESFNRACHKCKIERASCERFFKYKACSHATSPEDGFCIQCFENYKKRKNAVLERVQKLITELPVCLASKITAAQISIKIINLTASKFLLKHLPYIDKDTFEGNFKDIDSGVTLVIDPLDLGPQQHYMLNVKRYNSSGQLILNSLVIAFLKKHDRFSISKTKKEGDLTTIGNQKHKIIFNTQDLYEFTLTLNEESIHDSALTLDVHRMS